MMWIFKADRASAFSCETPSDLFRYIREMENAKLLEDHPEFGASAWSFSVYTPQRVALLYIEATHPCFCTPRLVEAYHKGLGLIEIHKGDIRHPVEILLTEETDMAALRKQWCLEYLEAHGYIVMEQQAPGQSISLHTLPPSGTTTVH